MTSTLKTLQLSSLQSQHILVGSGAHFAVSINIPKSEYKNIPLEMLQKTYASYHIYNDSGSLVTWDGIRSTISLDENNSYAKALVLIEAPLNAGQYCLTISLVTEGVCWWENSEWNQLKLNFKVYPLSKEEGIYMIAGGSGFENIGDEILLLKTVEIVQKINSNAKIFVSSNNFQVTAKTLEGFNVSMYSSLRASFFKSDRHYNDCDDVFQFRYKLVDEALTSGEDCEISTSIQQASILPFINHSSAERFVEALNASSRLIVHGGGILTSYTRSRLWEMALLAKLANRLKVPVAFRSHQVGPFETDEDVCFAQKLLEYAEFVSVRDLRESNLVCREIGADGIILENVDDAYEPFIVNSTQRQHLLNKWNIYSGYYIGACYRDNPGVGISADMKAIFLTALIHAATLSQMPVTLISMGPFDNEVLKEFQKKLATKKISTTLIECNKNTPLIVQNSFLLISTPHHPLIFAMQTNTPIISLVKGRYYLSKNRGSMRFFGLEDFVIDCSTPVASREIARKINLMIEDNPSIRRHIAHRAEELKANNINNLQIFKSFLTDC